MSLRSDERNRDERIDRIKSVVHLILHRMTLWCKASDEAADGDRRDGRHNAGRGFVGRKRGTDAEEEGCGIGGNNGLLSRDSLGQEPRTGPTDAAFPPPPRQKEEGKREIRIGKLYLVFREYL